MEVTTIESGNAQQLADVAREAGRVFDAGGLVIFPTETVYGIGASACSDKGFSALLDVKGRQQTQPFTIHIPHPQSAGRYVDLSHIRMRRLVEKLFPGPVTLVVDVPEDMMAERLQAMEDEFGEKSLLPSQGIHALGQRLYHSGTIGLRCPDDAIARRILDGTIAPSVPASANRRGEPPPLEIEPARAAVGEAAELIVDGGHTRYAKPSTIVRVRYESGGPVLKVEREGVYDERTIRRMLRWTMLLVCSGNTCRSPMAEAIAKNMVASERGIKADELEAAGVRILSAGAFTSNGMPAANEAIEAMNKLGIDLSEHRSRALTPELIREADVIYTMTNNHRDAILHFDREAEHKTFTLDSNGDIDDPIGGSLTVYQRCAELIRRRLEQRIREQQP